MRPAQVLRRVLQVIPTLLAILVLTFLLVHLLPGDPASAVIGDRVTDAEVARERALLGLDRALPVQFARYLGALLHGDLGRSTALGVPVSALIAARLPVTLMLTAMSATIALLISVPLALVAAVNRGRPIDLLLRCVFPVGLSMPAFYVGLLMLTLLAARLRLFPVGGYGDDLAGHLGHLLLPSISLAFSLSAVLLRNLRASLCDVLDLPHVEFAQLKGLDRALVLRRHVLRNALIPTVALFGLSTGTLLGGAVITETVFAIPGLGRLMVDSVFARDYPVIEALTLTLATLVVLTLLLTDLLQAALDPGAAS